MRARPNTRTESGLGLEALQSSRLGEYELREHLAAGEAGVVFDAVRDPDSDTPQIVALHVPFVRYQQDDAFQDAWLERTGRLRRLLHPQLVAVRDGGLDGVVWRVMERVGGWSLAAVRIGDRGVARPGAGGEQGGLPRGVLLNKESAAAVQSWIDG